MKATVFFVAVAAAQFPAAPTGLTTVSSAVDDAVTISYKQAELCETQAAVYSGYVHLPASLTGDVGGFDMHTYFLYFAARENPATAPLAIYLAGGPGESSTYAAFDSENGPCYVNVFGNGTIENAFAFSAHANLLYIDQPTQAGFSYSDLVNGTINVASQVVTPAVFANGTLPTTNATVGYGTFAGQSSTTTTNTTVSSAHALWLFAEHWLASFPPYTAAAGNDISVWGNSYGGFWVPETAVQLHRGLAALPAGHPLYGRGRALTSMGTTNGCLDLAPAMLGYPEYAYNNTYDTPFLTASEYSVAVAMVTGAGGCLDWLAACRASAAVGDAAGTGANATVNLLCQEALLVCETVIGMFHSDPAVSAFDIAVASPDACSFYLPVVRFLNNAAVQAALGVPLNFTMNAATVAAVFGFAIVSTSGTGDAARQRGSDDLAYLLAHHVRVALVYGDRDYRCPWTGGEATAEAVVWPGQSRFAAAGYEKVTGLPTDLPVAAQHGAVTRQAGLLSLTRVLDAGHTVSAYAPATVLTVFERTLAGVDVATGAAAAGCHYQTGGPTNSYGWRNTLPIGWPIADTCMVAGDFLEENPWDAVM